LDAEFAQLAVNPRCTPTWVSCTHASNQFAHLCRDWWTVLARATLPRPVELKAFAMPCDDSLRFDDAEMPTTSAPVKVSVKAP
jgi:hypothetical protein